MPRPPRQLIDGGIYHVINRGNGRMDLFSEDKDYFLFLDKIREGKKKYSISLFHYCLMKNHYHLLIQVGVGENLWKFMHYVQLHFAMYFTKRHGFEGHVFGQRFRSPMIPQDSYYLQCGRYIERNPVKAGLVDKAEDYPYSSAAYYALGKKDDLVTPNIFYEAMGRDEKNRRHGYQEFLRKEEPYSSIIREALEAT